MRSVNFESVKAGDEVIRMLASSIPMPLTVSEVDEEFIYCGPRDVGWKFSRKTGGEVDEFLGWDGVNTGSYLLAPLDSGE